jgi:hypothetical protein
LKLLPCDPLGNATREVVAVRAQIHPKAQLHNGKATQLTALTYLLGNAALEVVAVRAQIIDDVTHAVAYKERKQLLKKKKMICARKCVFACLRRVCECA